MAGDWIKVRCDLDDDPAVIGMAAALGIPEEHVCGCLAKVWSWFSEQTRYGHAPSVTPAFLDRHIRVTGFAAAMATAGWLDVTEDGVSVPAWDEHNSSSAKERALGARRKRRSRVENSHATVPRRSRPNRDKSVTRGEREKGAASRGSPSPTPSPAPAPPSGQPYGPSGGAQGCEHRQTKSSIRSINGECRVHGVATSITEQQVCLRCSADVGPPTSRAWPCPGCQQPAHEDEPQDQEQTT